MLRLSSILITTLLYIQVLGETPEPEFTGPIKSLTVTAGRDATLQCVVNNLGTHKVAWIHVDKQTLLTIHTYVIIKNSRFRISHKEFKTWFLQIKDVQPEDTGYYMCQINTQPMKSQVGHLTVVVAPEFVNDLTSKNITVMENTNVSLSCRATGNPQPEIKWKREDGQEFQIGQEKITLHSGEELNIIRVSRSHMGAYLCVASNGVPPAISRRIYLEVTFPPMIWIPNQLVGAAEASDVELECHTEAYPLSSNSWLRKNDMIITDSDKFDIYISQNTYKVDMKLTIRNLRAKDYGAYKCIAKNTLGETEGSITLYKIDAPMFTRRPPSISQPTNMPNKNTASSEERQQVSVEDKDYNPKPHLPGNQQKYGEGRGASKSSSTRYCSKVFYTLLCFSLILCYAR